MPSTRRFARLLVVSTMLVGVSACTRGIGAGVPGSTHYEAPPGSHFVAVGGSDGNSGSADSPWRTLQHAVDSSADNSTIVLRGGEYRQGNIVIGRHSGLTIQPYSGETVWFTGSDPLGGWTGDGAGAWVRDSWYSPLDNSPVDAALVDPAHPAAASPDMVFMNGTPQRQVISRSALRPGTFFIDRGAGQLFVGSDPSSRAVEVATRGEAILTVGVADTTIRGIGFHHYGTNVGALAPVKVTGIRDVLENDRFSENAAGGASVIRSVDALVRDNTFQSNGQVGLHGDHALRPVVARNAFISNNTENFTPISASGGIKFTSTLYSTIKDNSVVNNHSHGIWLDIASNHAVLTGNFLKNNGGGQIHFEASDDAIIANNIAIGGPVGILASRSTNFDIWNNTVYLSDIGIKFQRGDAGRDGRIYNNVVATHSNNLAIAVQDVNHILNGHDMGVSSNYNAYYRRYSSDAYLWGYWANWPYWELHASGIAEYRRYSGDELQSLSVENSANDPFIADPERGNFDRPAGSPANNRGRPLPSRVASVLGRPAGQTIDIGYLG